MQRKRSRPGALAIVVGGGPAPGINGVIAMATAEAEAQGLTVLGIEDGFKWLAQGDASHVRTLSAEEVASHRLHGGSLLYTSRENPSKVPDKMDRVISTLKDLDVRYLVTIGGDDTALTAHAIAHRAGQWIRVAHVPKTIDNDLPLPAGIPTFGFETARQLGANLVGNLLQDARTTRRWYVAVTMGRSAGHLALGMGVAAGADLVLIREEYVTVQPTLDLLCTTIEGAMIKAKAAGRDYGLVLVAEGVAELMKEELKELYPLVIVDYDEFGHLRLSEVPLALILKRRLHERARQRGREAKVVDATIGYELRCADPVPFDAEYTQKLGWGAVRCLLGLGDGHWPEEGAMISVQGGQIVPLQFSEVHDLASGTTRVRLVDIHSPFYAYALSTMTRLEKSDFEDEDQIGRLAEAAGLPVQAFREQYWPVVES